MLNTETTAEDLKKPNGQNSARKIILPCGALRFTVAEQAVWRLSRWVTVFFFKQYLRTEKA